MAASKRSHDQVDDQDSDQEDGYTLSTTFSQELPGPATKYSQYQVESTSESGSMESFRCRRRAHRPINFATRSEYEDHVTSFHANDCPHPECGKNFPTPRLQALHHAEHHDPIVSVKRSRGEKIYACFVEGCDKICMDWGRRKLHLMAKHRYPKNYDFKLVETGMFAGRNSLLRPGIDSQGHRRSSSELLEPMQDMTSALTGAHGVLPTGSSGTEGEDSALKMDDELSRASDVLTNTNGESPEDAAGNSISTATKSPPKLQPRRKLIPSTRLKILHKTDTTLSGKTGSNVKHLTSGGSSTKATAMSKQSQATPGKALVKNNAVESTTDDLTAAMHALRFVPLSVQKKQQEKAKAKAKAQRERSMDTS